MDESLGSIQVDMSYAGGLTQTCTILRNAARGGDGYTGESWATLSTAKCKLASPATGIRVDETDTFRRASISQYILFLEYGTDIEEFDRVTVDSKTYDVVNVYSVHGHHVQARLELVI